MFAIFVPQDFLVAGKKLVANITINANPPMFVVKVVDSVEQWLFNTIVDIKSTTRNLFCPTMKSRPMRPNINTSKAFEAMRTLMIFFLISGNELNRTSHMTTVTAISASPFISLR